MVLSFSSKENDVPEEKDDSFLSEGAKEISWSVQKRLCSRYRLLIESGKNTRWPVLQWPGNWSAISGISSARKCRPPRSKPENYPQTNKKGGHSRALDQGITGR